MTLASMRALGVHGDVADRVLVAAGRSADEVTAFRAAGRSGWWGWGQGDPDRQPIRGKAAIELALALGTTGTMTSSMAIDLGSARYSLTTARKEEA